MKLINSITMFVVSALSNIWAGFVFSKLWLWFVVWTFHTTSLGVAQSIGLCYLISFSTVQVIKPLKREEDVASKIIEISFIKLIYSTIILFSGWIVKQFL